MEIRNWKTGKVIYQDTVNTLIELVEKAVKKGLGLHYADLSDAGLHGANLRGADLGDADLRNADLGGANLSCADLRGAILRRSDLRNAYLSGADLGGADLRDVDLCGADFFMANFNEARNVPDNLPMACPKEGSFVAWKKVEGKLVKLEIPEDAKRSSATSNKCRCDKAKVLAITDLDGTNPINEVANYNYIRTITTYKVGEMVYPDSFDDNRWYECSHGIHFFMDKQEAIDY